MPSRKAQRQFPGATSYVDRHGRRRWRYRSKGFCAALGPDYGSEEFILRYEAALKREKEGAGAKRTRAGTMNALCVAYLRSPAYKALAASSRKREANEIDRIRGMIGDALVRDVERRHIAAMMAQRADAPASANHLRRMFSKLFAYAIDPLELVTTNPARDVQKYRTGREGFHSWTEAEIRRFAEVHPLGSTAHLAMTLMLYTGAARVDAVQLGWGNIRGDRLVYRRQKTREQTDVEIDIPIHADLAEALRLTSATQATFLETRNGKPRSPAGLGNRMRIWCDQAELPECTAHGLRKAIGRRLAEAGASTHEIMSVLGHSTPRQAEVYTRAAARRRMGDSAMELLSRPQADVAHLGKGAPNAHRKGLK